MNKDFEEEIKVSGRTPTLLYYVEIGERNREGIVDRKHCYAVLLLTDLRILFTALKTRLSDE